MTINERYEFHRQLGKNQKDAFHHATQDVIAWAQANGFASNKPSKKKK